MQTNNKHRFSIRSLLVSFAILSIVLAMYSSVSRFAISEEASRQIVEGLNKDQIRKIAGGPHHTDRDGWYYRVWNGLFPFSNKLFIGFDENGVADWVSF